MLNTLVTFLKNMKAMVTYFVIRYFDSRTGESGPYLRCIDVGLLGATDRDRALALIANKVKPWKVNGRLAERVHGSMPTHKMAFGIWEVHKEGTILEILKSCNLPWDKLCWQSSQAVEFAESHYRRLFRWWPEREEVNRMIFLVKEAGNFACVWVEFVPGVGHSINLLDLLQEEVLPSAQHCQFVFPEKHI